MNKTGLNYRLHLLVAMLVVLAGLTFAAFSLSGSNTGVADNGHSMSVAEGPKTSIGG